MSSQELVFLHFNDVYHISDIEIIARFLSHLEALRSEYSQCSPYTIFSGDIFSPSVEASILRGAHMLPLIELLKVDLGCYGNHAETRADFDFGEQRLRELARQTKIPWLLSNIVRAPAPGSSPPGLGPGMLRDDALLAGAQMHHTAMLQGFKVGFFGLAGSDWKACCRGLPECTILCPIDRSKAVTRHLRLVEKCDFVVALTHMRLSEDLCVSEALCNFNDEFRVDLLLGGHDHNVLRRFEGDSPSVASDPTQIQAGLSNEMVLQQKGMARRVHGPIKIVKSGTDWRGLSCVRLQIQRQSCGRPKIVNVVLDQTIDIRYLEHDPKTLLESVERVRKSLAGIRSYFDRVGAVPLVHSAVPLHGTESVVRSRESNLCNMIADVARAFYDVDAALINGGSVRCDKLFPATIFNSLAGGTSCSETAPAPLHIRDIMSMVPFNDALIVKRVTGSALFMALENSVSSRNGSGRFLHISGLDVTVDWTRPAGSRVIRAWLHRNSSIARRIEPSDHQTLDVAMVSFVADGYDGYTCFKDQKTLIGEGDAARIMKLLISVLGYTMGYRDLVVSYDSKSLERAGKAIIRIWDKKSRLPVIAPLTEARLNFIGGNNPIV